MRLFAALVLSCLVPTAAFADKSVTPVDDEPVADAARAPAHAAPPVDHRTPADVGELRAAHVTAPDAVHVDDGAGVAREHQVALAPTATTDATNSDVQAELATHQMKRHEPALAACVVAAHKRAPALTGSVTLDFDVADRKVRSVQLSDDTLHDAALATCLTSAARNFRFSLAAARFRWPVAVR